MDDEDDVLSNNNKESIPTGAKKMPVDIRLVDIGADTLNKSSELDSTSGKKTESPTIGSPEPSQSGVGENGIGGKDSVTDGFSSPVTRNRRSASRITSPNELSQDNSSNGSQSSNQRRPGKRKVDADVECETIDKIAAMIASSSPEFNPKNGRSTPLPTSRNSPALENGNLKDILDATVNPPPATVNQTVELKDRRFEDVEIKLEEMFAGIEDDIDQTKVKNTTKLEGCKEVRVAIESLGSLESILPKTENKKKTKAKAPKKTTANSSSTSDETDHKAKKPAKRLPKSKMKKGNGKKATNGKQSAKSVDNKKTKIKEETMDTTASKFRGPFVHVKGDGSSNVVNAPITEEVAENKSKIKKPFINPNHNDRSKIRGLHVSTLSMKYDASTTDKSWMCVFCKMGPHKCGLGDLFGPYILSTTSEDFELSQIDPAEDVFRSRKTKANMIQKRTLPSVAAGVVATGTSTNTTGNVSHDFGACDFRNSTFEFQKRKRKTIDPIPSTSANSSINCTNNDSLVDIFNGMTKTTDTSYEVWLHGDCAVWSSGVHLIGSRIVGLDAAVWSSTRHLCDKCHNYGAMLCCFKRGCGDVSHVPCARKANWQLRDDDFKILCDKHGEKSDKIETGKQT